MKSDRHVTVEKTAKKYKAFLLLSGIGIFVGVIWLIVAIGNSGQPAHPIILLISSLLVRWITKLLIWWNHG